MFFAMRHTSPMPAYLLTFPDQNKTRKRETFSKEKEPFPWDTWGFLLRQETGSPQDGGPSGLSHASSPHPRTAPELPSSTPQTPPQRPPGLGLLLVCYKAPVPF